MSRLKTLNEYIIIWQKKYHKKFPYLVMSCHLISAQTPFSLYCKKHGWFWITINNLFKGEECKYCKKEYIHQIKMNEYSINFIKKAKEIHGNKYDYSKVIYNGSNKNVVITCPLHGEFSQTPNNHLNGKGCSKCGKEKIIASLSLTNNEALSKAIKSHYGDGITFEKFRYNGRHKKSIFTCPIHGDFNMEYGAFVNGESCPLCAKEKSSDWLKISDKDAFERINRINNGRYILDRFKYHGMLNKSIFTCPIHGDFNMTPSHFLNGQSCKKCVNEKNGDRLKKSEDIAISEMKNLNNGKYNFDKFKYINAIEKGIIICPTHGEFLMSFNHFMRGQGCPKCNQSKLEKEIEELLMNMNCKFEYQYKIDGINYIYDFYLPKYNTLIECQGEQHFIPIDFSGKMNVNQLNEFFKKQQKRDYEKYYNAINRGYNVIYYTNPNNFRDNKINIYNEFYSDKLIFIDKNKLTEHI